MIGIYVDDLLITGADQEEIEKISHRLGSAFKMKHLGELQEFLGIEARNIPNGIKLTQQKYTEEIVRKFGQEKCKKTETPICKTYQDEEDIQTNDYPIREAIGCLTYLSNGTRPDISYAVNNVSRHVSKPTKSLWRAIQIIVKYLKSTPEIGLKYEKGSTEITGWADSDFAGDTSDRKSTTGWIFKIESNTVSWKSKKQKSVTLSTTEAEYLAASDAVKEAIWLQDLSVELGILQEKYAHLHQDNQEAIFLENNVSNKPPTKHIDIRYHFVREQVQQGRIKISYCETSNMMADILTKPLPERAIKRHRSTITNWISQAPQASAHCANCAKMAAPPALTAKGCVRQGGAPSPAPSKCESCATPQ